MEDTLQTILMREARALTSFDINTLTNIIYNGSNRAQARRDTWARVEQDIGTADTSRVPSQYTKTSREELYEEGLLSGGAAWIDSVRYNHDFFDAMTPRHALINSSPFGLNSMFRKAIELLASEEQRKAWLPHVYGGRWNGTYVQTELGHGSKFSRVETTATYCMETDTFDLHTPTTTATKFWPGNLGFSSTHGLIVARLKIAENGVEVDHGVHLFLLQIRDLTTGKSTPGIELGDVGLKLAHNQNDNGYAIFDHVHIPRTNLLMAEHSVERGGKYTKVAHTKAMHQTMTSIRSYLPFVCASQLAQAVTIAIRYSTVRQQGHLPFSDSSYPEFQIIRYKSQHFRLATSLSKAYAILFVSRHVEAVQRDLEVKRSKLDFSPFQSSHALQAGMKAWTSEVAAQCAEDARKCCGGQGYLNTSGLPEIVNSLTAICTLEGDNFALWQQTAGYLAKAVHQLSEKTNNSNSNTSNTILDDPELDYLTASDMSEKTVWSTAELLSRDVQISIFRQRALKCIEKAADRYYKSSLSQDRSHAWNTEMMPLISAARAHIEYIVVKSFWTAIEKIPAEEPTTNKVRQVLERLCSLFTLSHIIGPTTTDALTFLESIPSLISQLDAIRDTVNTLLTDLLPDLIGLTDAWDFTDASLASAIGMKDGNCYERLLNWTRQLPMNIRARENGGVDPNFETGVKSALRAYEFNADADGSVGTTYKLTTPPGSLHLFADPNITWDLDVGVEERSKFNTTTRGSSGAVVVTG